MIIIKTKLKESLIHPDGIGLFTDVFVNKGQVVILPSSVGLDIELDKTKFNQLRKEEQDFISHYGFLNKFNNKYHLNFDNARFINHSIDSNLTLDVSTSCLGAKRNIEIGEELTQDYSEFEILRSDLIK